jgi:hypothetical protein
LANGLLGYDVLHEHCRRLHHPPGPAARAESAATQPRVSEITRGKVELLSLDYPVGLCAKAGIPVNLKLAA